MATHVGPTSSSLELLVIKQHASFNGLFLHPMLSSHASSYHSLQHHGEGYRWQIHIARNSFLTAANARSVDLPQSATNDGKYLHQFYFQLIAVSGSSANPVSLAS